MTLKTEREPCFKCGSSDGFAPDDEGKGHCFSCDTTFSKKDLEDAGYEPDTSTTAVKSVPFDGDLPMGKLKALEDRGINIDTCRKYGVTVNTEDSHLYPYFNMEGEHHAVKFRTVEKNFMYTPRGVYQNSMLFGQQAFGSGGRAITITEGELDAMAAYQMHGSMYPCVSVQSSGSALKDCKRNWEWLNTFEKVYITFDNDDAGKKAAKKVADLFPGKAYVTHLGQHNDPCDYLVAGHASKFKNEWWDSKLVEITGFLAGEGLLNAMSKPVAEGTSLPWPTLDEVMYGVRMNELITLGAGSGLGKTETYKQIIYHMATVNDAKCGVIFLEESPAKTGLCVYGKAVNLRLQRPEYAETRIKTITDSPQYDQITKNLVVVNHKGVSDLEPILAKIEYLVTALGCKYVFLDHITAVCEGKDDGNVNHAMHVAMTELSKLLQRHEFTLFLISHLNGNTNIPYEEGGRVKMNNFYGSSAIKQWSNFVWGLEGNQQAEGEVKHHRQLRVLKDRELGEATGTVVDLKYDQQTGHFDEFDIDMFTQTQEEGDEE